MAYGVLELAEHRLERVVSLDASYLILAEKFGFEILGDLLQELKPLLKLLVRAECLHIEVRLLVQQQS